MTVSVLMTTSRIKIHSPLSSPLSFPDGVAPISDTHVITIYTPVQAAFTASPTSGAAPLTVVFTNTSSGDYAFSLWDFRMV